MRSCCQLTLALLMALDPAPFDLNDTLSTVVAMFASAAEDKGVFLNVSIAPNARGVFTAGAVCSGPFRWPAGPGSDRARRRH